MKTVNNVLFLDIDGVLYPCRKRKSFTLDPKQIRKMLEETLKLSFDDINDYTLLSVYEGWNKEAISFLQNIVCDYDVKIVISSSWKFKYKESVLKKLFAIHSLDSYIIDIIPNEYGVLKSKSIPLYLKNHPEIKNYVVVDDIYMFEFKNHFVVCPDVLDKIAYLKIKKILKKFKLSVDTNKNT